ncbi:hypothetical protein ACFYVL_15720 [Streptomyces sp. NPDC004111]|uniref:DUF7927 domain-containing protein n=1 Tax=Streptomyces sp. NPDC004111 TaxID=3364690 RepID=UPI0036BE42FB
MRSRTVRAWSRAGSPLWASARTLRGALRGGVRKTLAAVVAVGLVGVAPLPAHAADFPVQRDAAAGVDCDRLYYSNYLSGSQFDTDGSGRPVITNRVVSRRPTGSTLPSYWSANMAAGRDPDSGRPALFYSNYTTGNRTLYKQVQGSDQVTDVISGGATRQLPPGYNWGGLGADPDNDTLFGAENLSYNKEFFSMNLRTGVAKVFQPKAADSADTIWTGYYSMPDIFVDSDGFPYMGVYYGSSTYLYRIDVAKETATRVLQITGPGAQGGSLYGMAWFKDAIYVGNYSGQLYRVDPTTGASTAVSGAGYVEGNRTGTPTSENGGSWPITDLASCTSAPPLVPTLKVSKSAKVNGGAATSAKPGDTVTYTVKLENTSAVPYPGATVTDDLAQVLDHATYNADEKAVDGQGRAIGTFGARPPPRLSWSGTVPAGGTATLTYSVTVKAGAPDGARLRNSVTGNPGTNCAAGSTDPACGTEVPVEVPAAVTVVKTASPKNPGPGDKVTYTLTLTNAGARDYPGASVTDDLTGVLGGARYNDDATAKDGAGATLTAPAYTSPKLSWSGTVKARGKVVITYSATVRSPVPAGSTTLRNSVTSNVPGECEPGGSDPDCATVTPLPRLVIAKSSTPDVVRAGDKVTYTVTLKNDGDADWTGATATDDLTDVVDDAAYGNDAVARSGGTNTATQPAYDAATKKLTWTGTVARGSTVTITYTVTVGTPPAGNKRLANTVVGPDGSNCEAGSGDPDCTDDKTVSGLLIKKTASAAEAEPGGTVTYTVTAQNTGGGVARGVALTDDLTGVVDDATYNNDAVTRTGGANTATQPAYDAATKKLTWTGDIAAGATVTLTYTVTVGTPPAGDKKLSNVVIGPDGSSCPPGSTDPQCSSVTPVGVIDIRKTADRTDVKPGERITYTVTVRNTGEGTYRGATFTDDLRGVLDDATWDDLVTRSSGTTEYDAAGKTLKWTGDVAKGATVTVTYAVTVGRPPAGDKVLRNAVTGDGNCPPGSTDPACGTVTPVKSLTFKKTGAPRNPRSGDTVTYTVVVTNTGGAAYPDASFTDDLTDVLDDATWSNRTTLTTGSLDFDAAAKSLTWSGDLAVGATATITYEVVVTNAGDRYLRNVVSGDDSNCPPGSTDPDCREVLPRPGLEIRKTAAPASAKPGDTVTYTVTVRNTSALADYAGATFTDDLSGVLDDAAWAGPATATAGRADFDAAARTLKWTGDVARGTTVTVTYRVTVGTPPAGDKKLGNTVVGPGDSTCPPGSTDPRCGTVTPIGTVEIAKTSAPRSVKAGQRVTYTLTVRNTGEADYQGASFTDDLSGVLDDAAWDDNLGATSGTARYDAAGRKVTWGGNVAKGTTVTVTYTVTVGRPPAGDKKLSNVVVGPDGSNCPPGSTDPDCSDTRGIALLDLTKTANPTTAKPGDTVTYTVTASNEGTAAYRGASFTDDLSRILDDATYNDDVRAEGGGSATYTEPRIRWEHDLPAGASVTVTYSVTVDNPATGDKELGNTVVGPDDSSCPPNSTDPGCGTVVPVAALEIRKTAAPADPKPGEKVTYTVTVTNTGRAPYRGARFTDDLSGVLDDAVFNEGDTTADSGSAVYARPKLTWTGDVAVGRPVTVVYTVTVGKPPKGDKKLTNVVVGPDGSNCPPGSTDPECSTVTPVPALVVKKTADRQEVGAGDRVTYTLTIENTGEADHPGTTLTDDLRQVLDDATWDGTEQADRGTVTFRAPELTWTGPLPKGAKATVTYTVTVTHRGDKVLRNTAVVPGSNCEKGSGDPDCTSVVPPLPPADTKAIEVRKTGTPTPAHAGGKVTYTLLIRNTGTTPYRAARVTDDLTGVLDDAAYRNDARASAGRVAFRAPRLTWTGVLAVGATVTVRYSVTVGSPPRGDKRLKNVVDGGENSNCHDTSRAARRAAAGCGTDTPVRAMVLGKTATPAKVKPGGKVTFTLTARNTGTAPYPAATFTDDLRRVLDDATYDGDARASSGTVRRSGDRLVWNGPLGTGRTVTVTYSVTARLNIDGDRKLRNAVTSTTPGGNCVTGKEPGCHTDPEVVPDGKKVTPDGGKPDGGKPDDGKPGDTGPGGTRPGTGPLPGTGSGGSGGLGVAVAVLLVSGTGLLLVARRRG